MPYAFDWFGIWCPTIGKSTCSQEINEQSYESVRTLQYDVESTAWSQPCDIQFYKLEKLEVTFPVSDYFWSIIPTFDHLTSCKIISRDNSEECRRQIQFFISSVAHSSLAMECEELHIHVKKQVSIRDLVETMRNLRVLYVKCDDVENISQWHWNKDDKEEDFTKHELVIWLN